ncbi:hypothetical protein BU15DRAFT_86510 [Melanogaster broomeanus]|nr:hypothetical protein BU15DRAFT_86510 [Melanogaster broomeanus]
MDPEKEWYNPCNAFAYSLGEPRGAGRNSSIYCDVLRDTGGQLVPCRVSHATCQGTSWDAIQTRVRYEGALNQDAQLLEKTISYWAALLKTGCRAPPQAGSQEFYDKNGTRDHLLDYSPNTGLYEVDYLRALVNEDHEEILAIEEEAKKSGFDPAIPCTVIANHSSVRSRCPRPHRNTEGQLEWAPMTRLTCHSLFRVYQPLEEHRKTCPKVLIVCSGQHTHPIPLPTKTPPTIRSEIFSILHDMDYDLPDMTPRRFLRHPSVLRYVEHQLSNCRSPSLTDIHISLANRDHLRSYITQVQKSSFPFGTGWQGMLHLKTTQDSELLLEDHYIRLAVELPHVYELEGSSGDEEEDSGDSPFRLVICMLPENSRRLKEAQYLQSDIGFKRIQGFQEFELGGKDIQSNITLTYCRVFLTQQSAVAHQLVFQEIDRIIKLDTGSPLKWRHLHGTGLDDLKTGILQWTGDQHGGQAKGLGLHLQQLAQQMPDQSDLHEPHRPLSTLTEYDHLRRVYRLCTVHIFRNIRTSSVDEHVKNMMRSLVCVEHDDFQNTVEKIQTSGGKAGHDWVQDKIRSRFAFPAMCWAHSFIPRVVWQNGDATSNIIEALHADVNSEGCHCSLMKSESIKIFKSTGIRPSYSSGCQVDNLIRSVKRKADARRKQLSAQDAKLKGLNSRLQSTKEALDKANLRVSRIAGRAASQYLPSSESNVLNRAVKSMERANLHYSKALHSSLLGIGTGTGRVGLLLPSSAVAARRL